ncbi:Calx-beta domain-containing protein [Actinoplanes sp. N902-109]|uniref:Calx-beta domain-containing protein n=1 Tax=Actinoplanes sp. (strain N902-109) TaxID=649831 RepID=UPI0003295A6B|nr:Calx-beta domain-containing protein [Actinoplanes sp. N902-109]AGL19974.1 Na-Ca exchanger/integrin-beta4 [Actinoplanes sp. N902-109]
MRYQAAHAAKSGSVPFMLRGPKSVRTALSAAVAGAIGLMPAVLVTSPAEAAIPGFVFQQTAVSANEGSSLTFTVVRTGSAPLSAQNLTWTINPGTTNVNDPAADPADDYSPTTGGTLSFPAGDANTTTQNQSIVINTTDDTMDENDETFTITVSDNAVPANTITATGTITDNDNAPTYTLQLDDSTPGEAAGTVKVTAELSARSGKAISIPVSSADVNARSGQDYTAIPANTTLDIPVGQTKSAPLSIAITDDPLYEESEQSFTITGATTANVTGTKTATVTIQDNEEQSKVSIAPTSAQEGDPLQFPVTLDVPSEREVTVSYSTADGPGSDLNATDAAKAGVAKAGDDYTAVPSGTVRFPATTVNTNIPNGSTQQTASISTLTDSIDEIDPEDMHVTIASPTIAALGTKTVATGGIADDDDSPTVSLQPSTNRVTEGNTGKTSQTFTVKLNKASGQEVKVMYQTASDTAMDGEDFTNAMGTLTFAPGETAKTFTVDVIGDTIYEGDEDFEIWLSSTTATVPNSLQPVEITIADDDAKPTVTIASMTMVEGNGGSVAVFPVKLSNAASKNVVFTVDDLPGTATTTTSASPRPGQLDYIEPPAQAIVPAGQTTGYVYFLVNGDDVYETNETMQVQLTPTGTNVSSDVKTASLTITNDDTAPSIEVTSATANEGDKVQVMATTKGVAQDDSFFNVTFRGASVKGSVAASPSDFIDPGTVGVWVNGGTPSGASVQVGSPLEIVDDTTAEPAETILASGTGLGQGTVIDGVITIAANDGNTPAPGTDITLMSAASFRLGAGPLRLSGMAPAAANLTLWGKAVGAADAAPWENLGTTTAAANGAYSFTPEFTTTGWWFKVSNGDIESKTIKVNLKEDPDFAVRSSSKGKVTLSVIGDPKVRGLSVRVLRANADGSWTTVGTGILNASGVYTKTINGTSGKSYLFKATVYGDGDVGLLTNTSRSARVTVR